MLACPHCTEPLNERATRCFRCGKDPRSPVKRGPMPDTDSLIAEVKKDPTFSRWVDATCRLEEIAPAVCAWRRHPINRAGPRPDVHPRHRAEAAALELEIDGLKDRMNAEWRALNAKRN